MPKMVAARRIAALTILLGAPSIASAGAETRSYRSEYSVAALGIPIGVTSFETTITPQSYELNGTLRARGLIALFQPTSGSLTATGRIGHDRVEARDFRLDYISGNDKQHTEIDFSGGAVTRTVNAPEVKKRGGWIEVASSHLKDTLDPISAMLVPASTWRDVCNRTIRVFDGAMRADMKLSFLRVVPFSAKGYKGDAITCRARFVPVSGYPEGKKEVAWMRDKGVIDIAFAPIEGTSLFAPVKAKITTQIGLFTIYATRFETVAE